MGIRTNLLNMNGGPNFVIIVLSLDMEDEFLFKHAPDGKRNKKLNKKDWILQGKGKRIGIK